MPQRILIVEDDIVTARIYSSQLQRAGFEVEVASDGQKGLDQLATFRPTGLLIDFMMPQMNGLELVRRIRALPGYETTPLIVYSNAAVPQVVQAAKEAGATHLFDKLTLTPQQLIDVFKKAQDAPKP